MEQLREDEFAILDNLDDTTREMYDDAVEDMRLGFSGERRHGAMIVDVITKLVRALEQVAAAELMADAMRVEWVHSTDGHNPCLSCWSCENWKQRGHFAKCKRTISLAAWDKACERRKKSNGKAKRS